jgi:chromosome segregation ATPase
MTWLLLAAALGSAAGFGLTLHHAGQLQRELSATQSELSGARAKLAVLEAQRSEVHAQLKALSVEAAALAGRLAELEALAASDRPGATDAQALRSGSATGE